MFDEDYSTNHDVDLEAFISFAGFIVIMGIIALIVWLV